jgi:hypothetical protein
MSDPLRGAVRKERVRELGEAVSRVPLRREDGPHAVQPGPHSGVRPQLAPHLNQVRLLIVAGAAGDLRQDRQVGLDRLAGLGEHVGDVSLEPVGKLAGALSVLLGERGDDLPLEQRAGLVVREPGGPCPPGGLLHGLAAEPEPLAAELDLPATPRPAADGKDGGGGELPAPGRPSPARDDEDVALLALARRAAAEYQDQHGQPITRDALRARLGVSNQAAFELLRQLRAAESRPPTASHAA